MEIEGLIKELDVSEWFWPCVAMESVDDSQ